MQDVEQSLYGIEWPGNGLDSGRLLRVDHLTRLTLAGLCLAFQRNFAQHPGY